MVIVVFFFKQKTAYEMRISDWSSDVCSSDLDALDFRGGDVLAFPAEGVANPVNELDMRVALITNQIAGVEPAIAGLENIAQQFRVRTFLIGVAIERRAFGHFGDQQSDAAPGDALQMPGRRASRRIVLGVEFDNCERHRPEAGRERQTEPVDECEIAFRCRSEENT